MKELLEGVVRGPGSLSSIRNGLGDRCKGQPYRRETEGVLSVGEGENGMKRDD